MNIPHNAGPSLLIGLPTLGRPVPLDWAMAFKSLNPPINYNTIFQIIKGLPIDQARQQMAEIAVEKGCKYIFFLGDDVVVPNHTLRQLIYRMECDSSIGVVGGVYCVKAEPCFPLVFRGQGNGSYWDWKIGEFFEVTGLGMDCTLIRVDILKDIPKPWFKTIDDDKYLDAINSAESWTEDLYFFDKLLRETKHKVYCDATVICEHWDVAAGRKYGLPLDSPPMRQLAVKKDKRCLVLGNAIESDQTYETVTFGAEGSDYRGQLGSLPFAENEFDKLVVMDPPMNFEEYLPEWRRVMREKGKLVLYFKYKFIDIAYTASVLNGVECTNGSVEVQL